jgi:hypothetical protein
MNHLQAIESYPYLFATVLMLLLCLIASRLLLTAAQFRATVLSGLLNAPCCIFMPLLEDRYWSPRRVGGWILGLEDLLCSFSVAAMAWLTVLLLLRGKVTLVATTPGFVRRFNIAAGMSVGLFLAYYVARFDPMSSLILALAAVAIFLQMMRKDLWPLALCGVFGFPTLYWLLLRAIFWFWPGFAVQWNPYSVWGRTFLGVPLGEMAWATIFGAYWPLLVAYALGIQLAQSRQGPASLFVRQ